VQEGKEERFLEFEDHAIPLIEKYNGKMMYRVRPKQDSYVDPTDELPYEIHIISFDSNQDLANFMKDDSRLKFVHLKDESVKSTLLIKGELT
jgi:uncharacterized protein (DUF1330 family)